MRENYIHGLFQQLHDRCAQVERGLQSLNHVLQEIIGKELMRGQALHKLLMDKGFFTDAELMEALKKLIEESKADLERAKKEAAEAKAKAVELLVPAGANLIPPVYPSPEAPDVRFDPLAIAIEEQANTEGTDASPANPS